MSPMSSFLCRSMASNLAPQSAPPLEAVCAVVRAAGPIQQAQSGRRRCHAGGMRRGASHRLLRATMRKTATRCPYRLAVALPAHALEVWGSGARCVGTVLPPPTAAAASGRPRATRASAPRAAPAAPTAAGTPTASALLHEQVKHGGGAPGRRRQQGAGRPARSEARTKGAPRNRITEAAVRRRDEGAVRGVKGERRACCRSQGDEDTDDGPHRGGSRRIRRER